MDFCIAMGWFLSSFQDSYYHSIPRFLFWERSLPSCSLPEHPFYPLYPGITLSVLGQLKHFLKAFLDHVKHLFSWLFSDYLDSFLYHTGNTLGWVLFFHNAQQRKHTVGFGNYLVENTNNSKNGRVKLGSHYNYLGKNWSCCIRAVW